MVLYLMLELLYQAHFNATEAWFLLNTTELYFVPVVNIDGFKQISDLFERDGELRYIRKNRNDGSRDGTYACVNGETEEDVGVDLNRNYDFKWGLDDTGSSGLVCAEEFRGVAPFSEPETQAIRDFIGTHKDKVVMAFNFHAYGNLFIYPFNYDPSSANDALYDNFPEQALIYDEIALECRLPPGNIRGNAMQAIRYEANGEASDWMLGTHGIVAMSLELGIQDHESDDFFISSPEVLKETIVENAQWVRLALNKIQAQLIMTIDRGVSYFKKVKKLIGGTE
jgi:hypothetical protein